APGIRRCRHPLEVGGDLSQRHVRCADIEGPAGRRPDAGDLERRIADVTQPPHDPVNAAWIGYQVPDRVELRGDFHARRRMKARLDWVSTRGMYSNPSRPEYPTSRRAASWRGQSTHPLPGSCLPGTSAMCTRPMSSPEPCRIAAGSSPMTIEWYMS